MRALCRRIHNDFFLFLLHVALGRTYLAADSVVSSEVQSLPVVPRQSRHHLHISMFNQRCPVCCQLLPSATCVPTLAVLHALRKDVDVVGSHQSAADMELRMWNTSMSCLGQMLLCKCCVCLCIHCCSPLTSLTGRCLFHLPDQNYLKLVVVVLRNPRVTAGVRRGWGVLS